ncbi:MAG: glycosyltransferase [Chthoniobacterales bacterium]
MNRAFTALSILALTLIVILGWGWIHQPPSNQELLANFSKAKDFAMGISSVHAWPWWSPNYMQGTSLAPAFATTLTSLWLYIWSLVFGEFSGPKIAGLLCILGSALSMFAFIRRLTSSAGAAFACGVVYLFLPGIFVRLGYVEHAVMATAFVFIPLAFYGVLCLFERPSILSALGCAAGFGLLTLAYAKIAILTLPILLLFAGWVWKERARFKIPAPHILLISGGAVFLLAILLNIPALREVRFLALFDLGPFQGWQQAFSTKSALLWLDRDSFLSEGMPAWFNPTTAKGAAYFGIVPAVLLAVLLLFRRHEIYQSPLGSIFRLFATLALVAHWLSFGPRSVLEGHFEFLAYAVNARELAIVAAWFFLAFQIWLIFILPPKNLPGRNVFSAISALIYLLVPGFRLIEFLPLYSNIRAPFDFYQTTGIFCVAIMSGIAATIIVQGIRPVKVQLAVTVLAIALMALDVSVYFRPFFHSPLEANVFSDFIKTQTYLANAKLPGRVFPCSGRYFYLLTPFLANRGLSTEAFNSYLCQRGMTYLLSAALRTPDDFQSYLNITGVAYILIDKNDPDTAVEYQNFLRALLPVADENDNFVILENKGTLAPAFLAPDFVQTEAEGLKIAGAALALSKYHVATLNTPPVPLNEKGLAGILSDTNLSLDEKAEHMDHPPFRKVQESGRRDYTHISLQPQKGKGWLILPEAYHPDWIASSKGVPLPVYRAFEGLCGVRIDGQDAPIEFSFQQPWWYNLCVWLGLFSWSACGLFFLFTFLPFCPVNLKRRLTECAFYGSASPLPPRTSNSLSAIQRPLVIIPTYNESETLPLLLEKTFQVDSALQILIIDDNSPDGTAVLVEKHPEYGKRLHLLKRKAKLGLGSAYQEGFHWAFGKGFDACIEMDGDFSHDPADLPKLIAALNAGADIAIGSRYLGGIRVIDWPEYRLLLSSGASHYVRILTGLPIADATSGFKAIRSEALQSLNWKQFKADGYGFQIELHYFLWKAGFRMIEVPIIFTERRQGHTKMNISIAIEAAVRVIQLAAQGRHR